MAADLTTKSNLTSNDPFDKSNNVARQTSATRTHVADGNDDEVDALFFIAEARDLLGTDGDVRCNRLSRDADGWSARRDDADRRP